MKAINKEKFLASDKSNMYEVLKKFPEQVKEAITIGDRFEGFPNKPRSAKFVILGMGGSAIGGDLLASYLCNLKAIEKFDITTNRNYTIPNFIDDRTNVIASSYSGGTEETIAALEQALWKTKNIIAITSGGLLKKTASENAIPVITIPSGYQPRCAVGYSFFTMLKAIMKSGLFKPENLNDIMYDIDNTLYSLELKSKEYSEITHSNPAIELAKKINGTIPIIYTSSDGLESVGTRWVRQIQENAKYMVFNSFLPEMNHNEINCFSLPEGMPKKVSLIFIINEDDHRRTKIRFNALKEILSGQVHQIIEVKSSEINPLSRMFDLLYMGDWVSYYLALINEIDPTPIPLINKLKDYLSKY